MGLNDIGNSQEDAKGFALGLIIALIIVIIAAI
jgi:hypothetical protein